MSTTLQSLGIDRLSRQQRIELVQEIRDSIEAETVPSNISHVRREEIGLNRSATSSEKSQLNAGPRLDTTLVVSEGVNYSVECASYQNRKAELLRTDPGKFVVFVGEMIIGPFEKFQAAYREALRVFGHRPLYIKQVLVEDPIAEIAFGAANDLCRS